MSKWKWIAVAVFALVTICPSVKAQCTGYSANVTYTPLSPADAANRGVITGTFSIQAASDATGTPLPNAVLSHNVTVTPGTWIVQKWSSNNGSKAYVYYTYKGNTVNEGWYPLNGTSVMQVGSGDVGNPYVYYFVVEDANGNLATTDHVTINTVAGSGPSIVSQDAIPSNGYAEVTINFGGGSMLNNCQQCQGGSTQHCLQATHTPYVTMSAVNHTSGESQSLFRQQAGNIATATESVSGSGSIFISLLPGDTVDGTANGEILCSMLGDLPITGNDDFFLQAEWAWTKVSTIQSTCVEVPQMGGGVRCNVTSQYTVSQKCSPADLRPATVYSNFPVNGAPVTPATMPPFWWTWSLGIRPRVTGFPWLFPFSDLGAILQKDYPVTKLLAGAFPSNSTVRDATNYDKSCGVPSPFPPFDQP